MERVARAKLPAVPARASCVCAGYNQPAPLGEGLRAVTQFSQVSRMVSTGSAVSPRPTMTFGRMSFFGTDVAMYFGSIRVKRVMSYFYRLLRNRSCHCITGSQSPPRPWAATSAASLRSQMALRRSIDVTANLERVPESRASVTTITLRAFPGPFVGNLLPFVAKGLVNARAMSRVRTRGN